jgi:hypothetical protein
VDTHTHPDLDGAVSDLHGRLDGVDRRLGGTDDRLDHIEGNDVPHASWRSWGALGGVAILALERLLGRLL